MYLCCILYILCCRANAWYKKDDVHGVVEETEWTTFLQGNIMANMMEVNDKLVLDGKYIRYCVQSN